MIPKRIKVVHPNEIHRYITRFHVTWQCFESWDIFKDQTLPSKSPPVCYVLRHSTTFIYTFPWNKKPSVANYSRGIYFGGKATYKTFYYRLARHAPDIHISPIVTRRLFCKYILSENILLVVPHILVWWQTSNYPHFSPLNAGLPTHSLEGIPAIQ
jgi:hypothetical protein